jgi:hypothetical protein
MKLSMPDILKVVTGVPSWVYLSGGVVAALGAGAIWVSHHAAQHQAAKDAVQIAAPAATMAAGDLASRTTAATTQRVSHEAAIDTRTQAHVAAITTAPDSHAAFAEYLRGLHDDIDPLPSPVGGVQGGPGAPVAAASPGGPR